MRISGKRLLFLAGLMFFIFIGWNLVSSRDAIQEAHTVLQNCLRSWNSEQSLLRTESGRTGAYRVQHEQTRELLATLQTRAVYQLVNSWDRTAPDTLSSLNRSAQNLNHWVVLQGDLSDYPAQTAENISRGLNELSLRFDTFIFQQTRYFQNLNIFISILLISSIFLVFLYSRRNRQLLLAEQRAHALSRHLISDYEKRMHTLSLELHDDIAQDLYLLRIENERSSRDRHLDSAIEKIRRLSYDLRPGKAAALPINQGIKSLIIEFSQQENWQIDYNESGAKTLNLPYELRIHIFRIVQEALNNIKRHAGASRVSVGVIRSFPDLVITIRDNGRGFHAEKELETVEGGMGIRGMRERINILGGKIEISSSPGAGTTLRASIDIREYIDA